MIFYNKHIAAGCKNKDGFHQLLDNVFVKNKCSFPDTSSTLQRISKVLIIRIKTILSLL